MSRWPSTLATIALAALAFGLSAWLSTGRGPSASPETVPAPTTRAENLAAMGRLVYTVHCTRCHGPDGHGDGPDAATLKPPPRDFAASSWRFGATPESIRRVVAEGIAGTAMTGSSLAKPELEAVTAHVLALAPPTPSPLDAAGFRDAGPERIAPGFEIVGIDGRRRSLDDWRGEVILLAFWGTSCAPCMAEMPGLERLADTYRDAGLAVVPVCVDEADPARVAEAVRGRLVRLAPWIDEGTGRVAYDVQSTPTTLLIGRDGRILGRAEGARDWSSPAVATLLGWALGKK